MATNANIILQGQVPVFDAARSFNSGMELGDKINATRQSNALKMLLANPDVYNAQTGRVNIDNAAPLAQKTGFAGTLLPLLAAQNQSVDAARAKQMLEAQKAQDESAQSQATTQNLGYTGQGLQFKNANDSYGALIQDVATTSSDNPLDVLPVLQTGIASGRYTQKQAKSLLDQFPTTPEGFGTFKKSLMLRGAGPSAALTATQPKTGVVDTGGAQQLYSIDPMTGQATDVKRYTNTASPTSVMNNNTALMNMGLSNQARDREFTQRQYEFETNQQNEAKKRTGKGALPTPALKLVAEAQEGVDTASLAVTKLDKTLAKVDIAQLGMWNNLISRGRNFVGRSDNQSRAYERVQSGISDAVNTILMAAKGVQTDGDANRAKKIVLQASSNDPDVVKNALADLKEFSEEIKSRQQNKIGGVYANYGQDPNEYFSGEVAQPDTGKSITLADIKATAKSRGLPVNQVLADAKAKGYTVK